MHLKSFYINRKYIFYSLSGRVTYLQLLDELTHYFPMETKTHHHTHSHGETDFYVKIKVMETSTFIYFCLKAKLEASMILDY